MELPESLGSVSDTVPTAVGIGHVDLAKVHHTKKSGSMTAESSSPWDQKPWTVDVPGSKNPVLRFQCGALSEPPLDPPAQLLHMTYKTLQAETKLLTAIVSVHGMKEVEMDVPDFNLLWATSLPKPEIFRSLTSFQRVNHFPRSYELTRKDRLSKNIEKMQYSKGGKHFDFIPQTFVIPVDYRELCSAHYRNRGPWIVKPVASSRGRGIYIVNHPDEVTQEETVVVAKYIDDPLLIGGHKCDLRLYVAVTSYDPLQVYLYEEGLVRLATVKYDPGGKHLWNPCMHLCNYSINKYHSNYVKSEDPEAEDVGHKWTLSALLRHLRSQGQDTATLMQQVEGLVVKSILAAAPPIVAATRMFVPHPHNCFELYGFDILIDSALKPWLLEVNLSPSLGTDSPLDLKLKSAVLADLLTLVGVPAVDPVLRAKQVSRRPAAEFLSKLACRRVQSADTLSMAGAVKKTSSSRLTVSAISLSLEESRLVRAARSQFERRGGFVRIFPSGESWQRYGAFLDPVTGITCTTSGLGGYSSAAPAAATHNYNLLLHRQLFPELRSSPRHRSLQHLPHPERLSRYEAALGRGHKTSLDKLDADADVEATGTVVDYYQQICQCIEDGSRLSQWQARRLFSSYLSGVLCRLTGKNGPPMEDGHTDLIMRFLQKASVNLRTPYCIQTPSQKLEGKDREAVVAKQLYDFIYMYSRETDLYSLREDKPQFVPSSVYKSFIASATESAMEGVLSLHTRLYKCSHVYLGRCGSTGPGESRPLGLLQSIPPASAIRRRLSPGECDCTTQHKPGASDAQQRSTQQRSATLPAAAGKRISHSKVSRAL